MSARSLCRNGPVFFAGMMATGTDKQYIIIFLSKMIYWSCWWKIIKFTCAIIWTLQTGCIEIDMGIVDIATRHRHNISPPEMAPSPILSHQFYEISLSQNDQLGCEGNQLIHVGRIKMLHKHTHLPLCVLTACGHWTLRLNCLWSTGPDHEMYLNWLKSSDPNMVTKFLSPLVQVMACHKFGASHCLNQWWYIVNWNLRNKLMWNHIAKQIDVLLKYVGNVICKTVAILFRPWYFNS